MSKQTKPHKITLPNLSANSDYYKYVEKDDAYRRLDLRKVLVGGLGFVLVGIVAWISTHSPDSASAADLSKFQPGYIISDYVMSNYQSMTESEIQSFLKSKNSCNDTNIKKAEKYPEYTYNIKNGHFVCMADELFTDLVTKKKETAAHIIYEAAQKYKINPQVLIVLLEKEQSLVTDTWPNNIQYRSATGYACPDTAACDSKYYGLKNQIFAAADLFRSVLDGGWTNYPIGTNKIYYNPDKSCGSSTVLIKNLATSALYRYTPYQPNAAALAAYTGTASCGAYGNRNFYIYFNDWFGSSVAVDSSSNIIDGSASATDVLGSVVDTSSNNKIQAVINYLNSTKKPSAANGSASSSSSSSSNNSGNSSSSSNSNNTHNPSAIIGASTESKLPSAVYRVWQQYSTELGRSTSLQVNENKNTGMKWYNFEKGKIVGNDKKGWYVSYGGARSVWERHDFERGVLGFPTGNMGENKATGMRWQDFEGGCALGNDEKGWFISYGGARQVWKSLNFEMGALGFPTSDMKETKSTGMRWQEFEGGMIVGNDKKGWYESRGSIRAKWQQNGFEFGRYGFPTSNIIGNYQNYEGGRIYM